MAAMLLPVPFAGVEAVEVSQAAAELLTSRAVCEALLEQAQRVDRLLRTVSDRESAEKVAGELGSALDNMQQLCRRLENTPVENPEEARELAASMRSLTHVFQGYMPVVERLMEVNAYGSERLVNVFHLYKVLEGYRTDFPRQDSPRLMAYQEWADAVEFVLYHVRKLRAEADMTVLMPNIREAGARAERCRKEAAAGEGDADCDAIQAVRKHLENLRMELQTERMRLSNAGLLSSELSDLLHHCF